MKLFLLLALAAAAAATSVVFRPGEEYIYHYKGHVLSGIPRVSKQFAGVLIDTLVVLEFKQDYKVVMKLDKIKLFKINNKISTSPDEPLNENELTLLTGEQETILTEFLIKPIKFRYVDGEIQELEKESTDRYWSLNIKKGILSLFQVTLKDKTSNTEYNSFEPTVQRPKYNYPYSSRQNNPVGNSFWKTNRNSVYTVMETDVTGTCETKYSVISDKTHIASTTSEMHVTAVRDFKTCVTEPFYIQGIFQGVYNHPEEENILEPTVETSYVISGDRSHFLIKEAKLRGKYSFMVHGLEGGSMSTFIVQTLKLRDTKPISRPRTPHNLVVEKYGLLMVIPKAAQVPEKKGFEDVSTRSQSGWLNRRQTYQPRELLLEEEEIMNEDHTAIIPLIEEKLHKLIECLYAPTTEMTCSNILYQISRILRELPQPALKTICTKYITHTHTGEMEYRKSEILLDLLPTMSSPASSKVLIELIKERRISEFRASLMINAMTLVAKPTPSVVNTLLNLFKELPKEQNTKLGSRTLLRQSTLLGVGTMTHRMINVMRSHGKPVPEILNFIETISVELKRMVGETTHIPEKTLILNAMGNMGASQTISTIKNFVEDTMLPLEVRRTAVFALRRLAKQFRKQVIPILLGVFMDINEDRDLRISSFVVVIHSNPGLTTLQMIAQRLRHEPSSQVRTYVYSNLVALATHTSHEPEHKELKKHAKLVIRTIPPVFVGPHDSFTLKMSKFTEELDMGATLTLTKLKSKMSGLPQLLDAKLHTTLLGKHRHVLEAGVFGQSVEKVLRKTVGPHGMLSEFLKGKVTVEDFIRPLMDFDYTNVEYKVKELLRKTTSEMSEEEKPLAYWFLYILDTKIQYIAFKSENAEEVIEKVNMLIPELITRLTRGLRVDIVKSISLINSLTVASPIGIPLTVNSSLTGIVKIDGLIKVNNLPTISEMFRRVSPFMTVPRVSVDVDVKPKVDAVHYLSVGCNMRWLTSGVFIENIIKSNLPVKLNVHLKGPEHEISIKSFIPKQPIVMLHAKVSPHTFITYTPTTVAKLPYTFETKEIMNNKIVKVMPFEKNYKSITSGVVMETQGVISVCGPKWCPTVPLFGKQSITIKATPYGSVDFVHLKIKSLKSNFELEGIPASAPTEELYGFDSDEEIESEIYNDRLSSRRYGSRSMMLVNSGEFQPIIPDPIFTSEPIKRQVLVTFGTNTNTSPKVKGMFTWLMGRRYWKHQFNMQIVRLAHEETPTWKINMNSIVNPLAVTSLLPVPTYMYTPEPTAEFLTKCHVTWMYGGETNELRVKMMPGSPIDFSNELKEHKIYTALSLPEARQQKYKFTLKAEVDHLNHVSFKVVNVIREFVHAKLYDYISTSVPTTTHLTGKNEIMVAFEVLPLWEKMNIIVKSPIQNSYLTDIPLPWNPLMPTMTKFRLHDTPNWVWYKNYTYEERTEETSPWEYEDEEPFDTVPYKPSPIIGGECTVNVPEMTVTSFDDVTKELTSLRKYQTSSCRTLITKVCNDERLFSVIGTLRPTRSESSWKTKVNIPNFDIELESQNGRLVVIVNGEEKNIHTSKPLIITEDYSEMSPKVIKVEKIDTSRLELKLFELGVKIFFDSEMKTLKIKLAPWSTLQGELCGVCGNYNLDQSDDYTTMEALRLPSRPTFFERNVLPSDTCDVDRIFKTEDESCMIEDYLTLPRYENDVPMTCRSEKKITKCAPGCRPIKWQSVKTCLTCTTESRFSQPRRTYYNPRWEDDTGVECTDFYQRIEVPTICIPVY